MNHVKTWLLVGAFLGTSFCSISAFANASCTLLPGDWKGVYTIKDKERCKQFHGCQHLVKMNVEAQSEHAYRAKLTYALGDNETTFVFNCVNGDITLPVPSRYTVNTVCDSVNKCFISFDSDFYYAELMN